MNPDVQADIERRMKKLEATAVRYRAGEVTGVAPLDVALGGASTSYEDVRSVEGGLIVGDQVATLVLGNDLIVLGRILAGAPEAVTAPTFTNSWTNGSTAAEYFRHGGLVYLQGTLAGGASGNSAFTLPAGYRPAATRQFPVSAQGGIALVSVASAGTVTPFNIGSTAVNTAVLLDGIVFRAA